jgi:ribose/xylose/arabinose/galactoside ABC-type transport system permease subunit
MNSLRKESIFTNFKNLNKKSIIPTLLITYIIMIIVISVINPLFVSLESIKSILVYLALTGISAIGTTFVILTGNFDISIGSTLAITSIVVAKLLTMEGISIPISIVIIVGLLVGAAIGSINAFLVNVVGINSLIATLGTLAIFRGIAFVFSWDPLIIYDETFLFIGRGYIFTHLPITFVFLVVIFVFMYLILKFTRFGRYVYSIGGDSFVAALYGIKVKKIQYLAFIISGISASIAGILMTSQLGLGRGDFAIGWEFKIITICVLGGISISGGRGSLIGVFISIFILGSIINILTLANVPIIWRDFFHGIVLILAIVIDRIRVRRGELSQA